MSIHSDPHPFAGKTVTIRSDVKDPRDMVVGGAEYQLEDWWDRLSGSSWTANSGNPAVLQYALRIGLATDPPLLDDEVVYGKIGGLGHLAHVTELDDAS